MKQLAFFFLLIAFSLLYGQKNTYLIGNAMLGPMLDERTLPDDIGTQFSSRLSIAGQTPIYYDSSNNREVINLEIGIGNLFNSIYYKESPYEKPRSSGNINVIDGLFLKVEPSWNFWMNDQQSLFLHASLNNVLYYFGDYEVNGGFFNKDTNEVRLITTNTEHKLQFALEPYLGVSYLMRFKRGSGLLFRLKHGLVFHDQAIALMQLDYDPKASFIRLNDQSWVFSVGWLLSD